MLSLTARGRRTARWRAATSRPCATSINKDTRSALIIKNIFGGDTWIPNKVGYGYGTPCIVDSSQFDLSSTFDKMLPGFGPCTFFSVQGTIIGHTRDNPSDHKEEFRYVRLGSAIETPASMLSKIQNAKPQWLQTIEKAYSPAPLSS